MSIMSRREGVCVCCVACIWKSTSSSPELEHYYTDKGGWSRRELYFTGVIHFPFCIPRQNNLFTCSSPPKRKKIEGNVVLSKGKGMHLQTFFCLSYSSTRENFQRERIKGFFFFIHLRTPPRPPQRNAK